MSLKLANSIHVCKRGDLFNGLAAIVALPPALAFGVASGVGVIAGLTNCSYTDFPQPAAG